MTSHHRARLAAIVALLLALGACAAPAETSSDGGDQPSQTARTAAPDDPPPAPSPTTRAKPSDVPASTAPSSSPPSDGSDDAQTVAITDFSFGPQRIAVPSGGTVEWVNDDQPSHTVKLDGIDSSGSLATGDRFSHTFDMTGTVDYVCELHPFMTGTVVVE